MNSKTIIITAIIIATIIASIGVYHTARPSSQPLPPSPEVPERVKIAGHTSYVEETRNVTFFTVKGLVQNNLTTNIRSVNITATFYDAENKTIGTEIGHTELDIIKPEQKAPFEIYVSLGPSAKIPARYKLEASCIKTDKEPVIGVKVIDETSSFDEDGYYTVRGEVQNTWKTKAVSVKTICVYYDLEGNIIRMSHAYISPEINAGGKAPFEVSSKPYKINPASYELFVVVHRYEPILISNYILLAVLIMVFATFAIYMKKYRGW